MISLFFISTFFTSIFSQKFCVNCRFYVKSPLCSNAFAKCSAFPEKSDNQLNYLISGKRKIDYKYCYYARENEDLCGLNGKSYMEKINLCSKSKKE